MINPVDIFRALGDETRLRLVNLVLQAENDLCVCEMVDTLGLPQYQISKHLTILKNAGLLQATRRGTWVYYRLDGDAAPLLRVIFRAQSPYLGSAFTEDAEKLDKRLRLRQEDKCLVRHAPTKKMPKA